MRKMLSSKGLRFVTTLIFIIVMYLLFILLPRLVMGERYAYVDISSLTLFLTVIATIVLQLLGDVLNFNNTDHGFLAVVKRVVFDVVAVLSVCFALALSLSSQAEEGANLNLFETALMNTRTFVLPTLCLLWLIATTKGFRLAAIPFLFPASMAGGYLLSLIFSALFRSMPANKSGFTFALFALLFLVVMIIWRIKAGAAFSNMGTDGGDFAHKKTSYTSSYQASPFRDTAVRSSGSSTSTASGTSATKTSVSSGSADDDEAFDPDDFRSDLADCMDRVKSSYTGYESFGVGYSKVTLRVECRINHAEHSVCFFVYGRTVYSGERSVKDSEEINDIYRTTKEGILSDAEDYISRLRRRYGAKAPNYRVKIYINR